VDTEFSIKNYGASPAFLAHESMSLLPVTDPLGDIPSIGKACNIDAYRNPGRMAMGGVGGNFGEMILPGATKIWKYGTNMAVRDDEIPKALSRVYITVCILFQDRQTRWHYSGYRYMTSIGGNAPVNFPDHPGWSYIPFTSAGLVAADSN
jgi:hypothetical protein